MPVSETKLLMKYADEPGYTPGIESYLAVGGYEMLKKAVGMKPEDIRGEVKASGLRGRGGAGFPCGVKWDLVDRKSGKPIYLICNCDESEPGTFKDRQLVHKDPHQLIEGMMISAFANDVKFAVIYIREEMPKGAKILDAAIDEARARGFVGSNICGTGFSCELIVHRGAGAYICGEETGLIESLEGKRAYPRIKPPYFPAVLGLYNCPTIVNNVETLCNVVHILRMGAAEYCKIGRPNNTGTRLWCVSGHVQRPGYYEVAGITMGQLLYDLCGGPLPGRSFKAIVPGGGSMKILRYDEKFKGKKPDGAAYEYGVDDIPLDFDGVAAAGSMSGSAGMMVMDDSVDILEALANLMQFYAHESCGQCTPCREGSQWARKITARMCSSNAKPGDLDTLYDMAGNIGGRTVCPMGFSTTWPVQSYIDKFRDEIEAKARDNRCGMPREARLIQK
ncbi:NADH-quinone oxidoreductase subunit NuoF [Opitutales bacterium ASA1]|uniref:NADH-quinone oxidoreductase subunit NuoF n=1 Tax=Congregicoccus parvus TaxID=3081749 RepID=UPI002B2966E7|nr:NADH-quinone oxidoreductase subunit NuoF [Opitutales bacterium ASA1]